MDKIQVLLVLPGKILLSRSKNVVIGLSFIHGDTLLEDQDIEPQKARHRTCQSVATSIKAS